MNLVFQNWINNQQLPDTAKGLIEEAIICYKVSAYRAALLMSYLSFQTVLKHRILKADKKPENVSEGQWQRIINNLKDDKEWDDEVFKATQMQIQGVNVIFMINNDLREELRYWRSKRNDCAHSKASIISYSHVESFWFFLQSNLSKFTVNGGKEGLLKKIMRHFNVRSTNSGTSSSYLIEEILHVVKQEEIEEFLIEVHSLFKKAFGYFYIEENNIEILSFWKQIANYENVSLRDGFLEFIKSDWDIFREFIPQFSGKLLELSTDVEFITTFWKEEFFKIYLETEDVYWELVDIMIRNKLIPDDKVEEFLCKIIKQSKFRTPAEKYIGMLKEVRFFKIYREYAFEGRKLTRPYGGYIFANRNCKEIAFYIKHNDLDTLVVKELNKVLNSLSYGDFYNEMKSMFQSEGKVREQYIAIAEHESLELPDIIK